MSQALLRCRDSPGDRHAGPLYEGFGFAKLVTNAELEECHGRVGEVMFNGRKQRIYRYVLNNEYPYSIGCFRGTPRHMGGMH